MSSNKFHKFNYKCIITATMLSKYINTYFYLCLMTNILCNRLISGTNKYVLQLTNTIFLRVLIIVGKKLNHKTKTEPINKIIREKFMNISINIKL